jgi:hypothetical protein
VPVPPLCGETTCFILHLFRFIRLKDKSIYRSIAGDLYWSYLALKENSSQLNTAQALVSFKKYMPPPLPYFKVNIYPFPLPHFASIFFAYL